MTNTDDFIAHIKNLDKQGLIGSGPTQIKMEDLIDRLLDDDPATARMIAKHYLLTDLSLAPWLKGE